MSAVAIGVRDCQSEAGGLAGGSGIAIKSLASLPSIRAIPAWQTAAPDWHVVLANLLGANAGSAELPIPSGQAETSPKNASSGSGTAPLGQPAAFHSMLYRPLGSSVEMPRPSQDLIHADRAIEPARKAMKSARTIDAVSPHSREGMSPTALHATRLQRTGTRAQQGAASPDELIPGSRLGEVASLQRNEMSQASPDTLQPLKGLAEPQSRHFAVSIARGSGVHSSVSGGDRSIHRDESGPLPETSAAPLTERSSDETVPSRSTPAIEQELSSRAQAPAEKRISPLVQEPDPSASSTHLAATGRSAVIDGTSNFGLAGTPDLTITDRAIAPSPRGSGVHATSQGQPRIDLPSGKTPRGAGQSATGSVDVFAIQNSLGRSSNGAGLAGFPEVVSSMGQATRGPANPVDSRAEPFATMDEPSMPGSAKWTMTGTHLAEAGFQDSTLGWVAIRAQETAGAIHATVIPSAAEAANVLSDHLAGLNAHMASQSLHVGTISLGSPDTSAQQAMGEGQGQQRHQSPNSQENRHVGRGLSARPVVTAAIDPHTADSIVATRETGQRVSIRV
jgi:hypothetical protein